MQWEYKVVPVPMPGSFSMNRPLPIQYEEMRERTKWILNEFGLMGWEAYGIVAGHVYLKRVLAYPLTDEDDV